MYDKCWKKQSNALRIHIKQRNRREICQRYISLAFLYTKLKRYTEAIDAWERIINVLASDFNITEGETIDWPKREIETPKQCLK